MDTLENYHDIEFNPNALLRSIFWLCEEAIAGGLKEFDTIEKIHHGIEHFSATSGMSLSDNFSQDPNEDEGIPF